MILQEISRKNLYIIFRNIHIQAPLFENFNVALVDLPRSILNGKYNLNVTFLLVESVLVFFSVEIESIFIKSFINTFHLFRR